MEERMEERFAVMDPADEIMLYGNRFFNRPKTVVPIWRKSNLSIEEAAAYSGVGQTKLRKLSEEEDCPFVLWIGTKRLIKRKKLDEFLEAEYSI